MLADCLGRHPALYIGRREARLIPYLIETTPRLGDLTNDKNFLSLWERVLSIPMFLRLNQGLQPPLPENWQDFPRSLAAVLDGTFRFFAAREGKIRWGEKSPQNAQHLQALAKLYPKARFIHMIRDGRDTAASFHRRWQRTPELTIYRWKKIVEEGRAQGKGLGDRYMELKYEEITQNPERWMKEICRFLDVEFSDRVLISTQPQKENQVKGGGIVANSGRWRRYFQQEEIKRLETISGAYLESVGYPILYEPGNQDPNNYKVKYWTFNDYVRQTANEIKKGVNKKNKKLIPRMASVISTALKQMKVNRY